MKEIKRAELMEFVSKDSQTQIINSIVKTFQKTNAIDIHNFIDGNIDDLSNRFISNINNMILSITNVIHNATESKIRELLLQTTNKDKVVIKLFSGITIDSSIIPEREKRNNFTGEVVVYPPYIKPKFNVSKNYVRTLNRIT